MALIKGITYEEEIKKNPNLKESDIQMLREWLNKQPHLPTMTDSELTLFLHSNYYRIESTKATIDTYYTVKTHVPEFFSHRDPLGDKGLRQAMRVGCVSSSLTNFSKKRCINLSLQSLHDLARSVERRS